MKKNHKILIIGTMLSIMFASCEQSGESTSTGSKPVAEVKATWSSCTNWQGWATDKYYFRNNIWGSGNSGASWQCVWANSSSNWGATSGHQNSTGSVKGYPQMIVGWSSGDGYNLNGGNKGGLTKKHQDYANLKVYWNFTAPTASPTRYLSLIDIYSHWNNNPAGNTLPRTNIQLMTHWNDPSGWFDNVNNVGMTYKGEKTIDGITYKAYYKSPHPDGAGDNLIQVRPNNKTTNATHNIKAMCAWLVSLGIMSNDEYITSIQAGWEMIDGNNGAAFQTNGYSVTAN